MDDTLLVETDSYDRHARIGALAGPSFEALIAHGERLLPHFRSLVEDLFAVCFKLVIRLRPEASDSLAWNRRVLEAVLESEAAARLREACALDGGRAASAAVALGRAVLDEVRRGELFTEEELAAALALQGSGERVARLRRLREASAPSEMRDRVDRELGREEERHQVLSTIQRETLDELPRGLDERVDAATRAAAERLAGDDERFLAFAEGIGGGVSLAAADRIDLAEQLHGNEKLLRLAALVGAFRADALATRRKRIRRAPSELHRVGRGGDLARILPSELAAFTSPEGRRDFLRRLVERDLAAYDLEGADRGGRGPLVICVDGSGSMRGSRELWAKGVSLALLEIARRQNRSAAALVFSGADMPVARFDLLPRKGRRRAGRRVAHLPEVVEFATHFPGGGTSFEKPLREAMALLREARLRRGDVVFVTDGAAPLSGPFIREVYEEKRRLDFSIYAVLVDDPSLNTVRAPDGTAPGGSEVERGARELRKIADRLTTVSRLTSASVRDLFERL